MIYRKVLVLIAFSIFTAAQLGPAEENKYFEITKNLEIFGAVYKELNKYYVDELDPSVTMRTALDAMVESLDPYTVFYSESEIERYKLSTEGEYNGIGAEMEEIDGYLTVTQSYRGYPAEEAGLKAGDQVIGIGDVSVKDLDIEKVKLMMSGSQESLLRLKVRRPTTGEVMDVEMLREKVKVPNVPHKELIAEDVGYVNLSTFTQMAAANVKKAIDELASDNEKDLKGLVLDLRQNGGGLLSEAVNLCNIFLPKGKVIVSTRGKVKDWDKVYKTRGSSSYEELPVVILVDEKSASASEIVSGAIQDYDRGVVMGQKTYGKGLVQNVKKLDYNSQVKITTSKYYIPSGRCIQSVAYEDGEPVEIADSLKTPFKTENGRTVLEGGGVEPDIFLDPYKDSEILKALKKEHAVFKFVNHYIDQVERPADYRNYRFSDYDAFIDFVTSEKIELKFTAEKELGDLEKTAKEFSYYDEIQKDMEKIRDRIADRKEQELEEHQEYISHLIAEEIISRFEYVEGRLERKLQFDPEIMEAVQLLSDSKKYSEILQPS